MNVLNGLLFSQKSSITDVRLGYILASEIIEIFKVKLKQIILNKDTGKSINYTLNWQTLPKP